MEEQGRHAVYAAQIYHIGAGSGRGGQVAQELVLPTRVGMIDDIEKHFGHGAYSYQRSEAI
jgi:hypothetical protein